MMQLWKWILLITISIFMKILKITHYQVFIEENADAAGFTNPSDVVTGEYPDATSSDEHFWALAELYKTTGDAAYGDKLKDWNVAELKLGLGWAEVGTYGVKTYLSSENTDAALAGKLEKALDDAVKAMNDQKEKDAYASTLGSEYPWGSNMTIANNGMLYLMTGQLAEAESQWT